MIARWVGERGHTLTSTAFYETEHALPQPASYDALIVMGGPMGVHDEERYPWLKEEKRHIASAIHAGKNVLGICLGAQLIADVLGAKVAPQGYPEIGWFPVTFTDAAEGHPLLAGLESGMTVFHWHGDRFEIPSGALHLAESAGCPHQAFLYGNHVLGLQCHLEMDAAAVERLLAACADDLRPSPHVQDARTIRENAHAVHTYGAMRRLLDNWCDFASLIKVQAFSGF